MSDILSEDRIELNDGPGRRIGLVVVSTHLLLDALAFPEGTTIVACYGEGAAWPGEITLAVEHPDLPITPEGSSPHLRPTLHVTGPRPASYITFDWNLNGD